MDLTDGFVVRHQLQTIHNIRWQRLGEWRRILLQERQYDALYGLGIHSHTLHLLGGRVHAIETRLAVRIIVRLDHIELRMRHAEGMVKLLRLAEEQVLPTLLHALQHVADAIEPYTLYRSRSVGEERVQAMSRATLASSDLLHRDESSLQEDVRHGTVDVADSIDLRLIDVPVRIVRQEVLKAVYIALRLEDFCPLRADTWYVL